MSYRSSGVGVALSGMLLSTLWLACGSRGPLDDSPLGTLSDASTNDVLAPMSDAAVDASPSPIIEIQQCATCLQEKCGQTFGACLSDPKCQTTVQCLITQCAAGGSLDTACALKCADGDLTNLLTVLQAAQCPSDRCRTECPTLVQTLGGLVPGGKP